MRKLAIFDFDGTITNKDSFIGLIRQASGLSGLVYAMFRNLHYLVGWKLHLCKNSCAKQHVFSTVFKGKTVDDFEKICRAYFNAAYPAIIREGVTKKIQNLIADGFDLAIVSASSDFWVRPFANALGIDKVIGTGVEIENGILTGKFSTPNCHGAEKVRRIGQIIDNRDNYHIIAFGDSSGDKCMLSYADEGYYKFFG